MLAIEKSITVLQKRHIYKSLCNKYHDVSSVLSTLNTYLVPSSVPLFKTKTEHLTDGYDNMTKFLQNKDMISKIDSLMKKLDRYHPVHSNIVSAMLTTKKFLIAWLITAFPEFVLEKSRENLSESNGYPDEIYFISKNFINQFNLLMTNKRTNKLEQSFKKSMNVYCNAINYFLNKDKVAYVNKLILEWLETYETLRLIKESKKYPTEDEKKKCMIAVLKTKQKITTYLTKFVPEITEDKLKQYAELITKVSSVVVNSEKNLLIDDIKTKKYILLKQIIDTLKNNIIGLAKSYKDSVDIYLNSDVIIETINHMSILKVNEYGDYLIDIINKLEAPAAVNLTNDKWTILKSKWSEYDIETYMTEMIFLVLNEIRLIKENIVNIYTMISLGINPFIDQVDSNHGTKNCRQIGI
jgi:hypothetical protein